MVKVHIVGAPVILAIVAPYVPPLPPTLPAPGRGVTARCPFCMGGVSCVVCGGSGWV
jgi:hypothetical protein